LAVPWQAKHYFDRMGRISRLKSTLESANIGDAAIVTAMALR